MTYYFFNYETQLMVMRDERSVKHCITDGEFAVLQAYGKLDIGYGMWMHATPTD